MVLIYKCWKFNLLKFIEICWNFPTEIYWTTLYCLFYILTYFKFYIFPHFQTFMHLMHVQKIILPVYNPNTQRNSFFQKIINIFYTSPPQLQLLTFCAVACASEVVESGFVSLLLSTNVAVAAFFEPAAKTFATTNEISRNLR